jgi:V/A-type H+-transporting ATPase subunit I
MARVAIWGTAEAKSAVVDRLYGLGALHLETSFDNAAAREKIKGSGAAPPAKTPLRPDPPGRPLLERLREQRGKVLGLIELLQWDGWKKLDNAFIEKVQSNLADGLEPMMDEIDRSLERIRSRLDKIRENRESAQGDFVELRRAGAILARARAFLEQERSARGEIAIWNLPRREQHFLISKINGELDFLPSGHEKPWFRYHSFDLADGSSYLVTSASREVLPHIRAIARGALWKLPPRFREGSLLEGFSRIRQILRNLPSQMRGSKQELRNLSAQWGANLAAVYILLNERLDRLLMEVSAEDNGEFFNLEGWIPERDLERTVEALKKDFGDAVIVRSRPPDASRDGVVPTALQNHPLFKPFELFLKLLRVPRYTAYDPSPLIGIFFPFFAGCMIGDLGYGLLVLALGWHLRRKKPEVLRDVGVILLFIAFWSAAWGAMFGEFFGDVGHRLLSMKPLWVDRAHAVLPVMAFSIALGGAHVLLGIFIGMVQGLRHRNRHLWMERAGTLLFILSLVSALALLRAELPSSFFSVPVVLLVFALIFLVRGGGVGGIIESLGTVGNIISYVRIAAIGLSSAILAMVASTFVDIFGVSVLGLFMAFAIHLLNFVLAVGGSSLHAARLHYVEFMGKFYEDGTLEYKPFGRKRPAAEN